MREQIRSYKERIKTLEKDLEILNYFKNKFEVIQKDELDKNIIAKELNLNIEVIGKILDKYQCFKHWSVHC